MCTDRQTDSHNAIINDFHFFFWHFSADLCVYSCADHRPAAGVFCFHTSKTDEWFSLRPEDEFKAAFNRNSGKHVELLQWRIYSIIINWSHYSTACSDREKAPTFNTFQTQQIVVSMERKGKVPELHWRDSLTNSPTADQQQRCSCGCDAVAHTEEEVDRVDSDEEREMRKQPQRSPARIMLSIVKGCGSRLNYGDFLGQHVLVWCSRQLEKRSFSTDTKEAGVHTGPSLLVHPKLKGVHVIINTWFCLTDVTGLPSLLDCAIIYMFSPSY